MQIFSVSRTWSHRGRDWVGRVVVQTLGIHFGPKIIYWNSCGGRLTLQDEKPTFSAKDLVSSS